MTQRIHAPRLLPATIAMLAVVLAAKSTLLVRSAIENGQPAAFITAALAGGPGAPAPAENQGNNKPGAKPGDYGNAMKPAHAAEPPNLADMPSVADAPPPMTAGEKAVLLELRDRRKELEAREAALASRESLFAAAEKKLSERVEELQSLQKQLESLDTSHRQQEDTAWQGLVKVYETMKPRDAAAIFNDLGMPVLQAVIGRMKEAKAAAILAAMTPEKAREVTTQLALVRTNGAAADAAGKAALNPEPGKPPGSGT